MVTGSRTRPSSFDSPSNAAGAKENRKNEERRKKVEEGRTGQGKRKGKTEKGGGECKYRRAKARDGRNLRSARSGGRVFSAFSWAIRRTSHREGALDYPTDRSDFSCLVDSAAVDQIASMFQVLWGKSRAADQIRFTSGPNDKRP